MRIYASFLGLACLLAGAVVRADDWPQFRGPKRDGVSHEKGLLQAWPKEGPKLLWTYRDAGMGFSSHAVMGDVLYTMGGFGDSEYLLAIDVKKPAELWRVKVGPLFSYGSWGDGPRSTPTIDGDKIYALGGHGDLVCADSKGKELWRKNLVKDLGGKLMECQGMIWGYSESVLIDGPLLICTPGGDKGTLAALDKNTGDVVWRSTDLKQQAPYSSIMPAELHGVRQYIQTSYIDDDNGGHVSGIAAKDGKVLWSEPTFKSYSYAIAPNPIIDGAKVYVTSGYGGGCFLLDILPKFEVKNLYGKKQQKAFKNTHGGVVLLDGKIYGHTETQTWACQELETGNALWTERNRYVCKSGATIAAGGRLYLLSDVGEVVLLVPDSKEWQEAGNFELPEKSKIRQTENNFRAAAVWAHPVVANGRLYLRDQELIFCYDVKQ